MIGSRYFNRCFCRLLPVLLSTYVLLSVSDALAQSSVGRAANSATGQSLRDAIEQVQNDLIDRDVFGGAGQGGSGQGAGALGATASPTARLRRSDHDALEVPTPDENNYAWDTREASAFGTGSYTLPGIVLGGQVRLSFFAGHNWLSLEMKNGGGNILDTDNGQFGKAANQSAIVGGTMLWAHGSTYALTTIVGMWGNTTLRDAIDFCNGPGLGCPLRRYNYDTRGFLGSLTAGHVYSLSPSPTGPKLDLRSAAGYTRNIGDTFANFQDDEQTWTFSTWTLTGSATLFANMPLENAAVLRPYVQGYVRHEIDYRNKLRFALHTGETGTVLFDQAHTYGGVDAGLTYALASMTLGAAVYYEGSGDERTLGGRVGMSWKLN